MIQRREAIRIREVEINVNTISHRDAAALEADEISIAVMQQEGVAIESWPSAKVVASDIGAALDLPLDPRRLAATLRA